ncbi:helix-turn-helix transcriptional regulator [Clostridium sp. Sa3CUN1]|uniref:Helix-turn-helix transcriptional regulator n=1 Tax=Clostridium gallinarum TaxID=2762246 RepID=A0ABR8Q7B6_9CLOT|nr:helix-turn-helix transcriptional regulator [Clostridium gallinarum]MBD7916323.1 helix-turn-helix transcriptional regulator [Clostridium gallinarum]
MDKELLKGFIDILILSLLSKKDMYAYEISKVIMEYSNESVILGEGTLYPALKRFYENGYLDYYWVEKENNLVKRKYYRITIKGKEYLNYKKSEYKKIKSLIDPLI